MNKGTKLSIGLAIMTPLVAGLLAFLLSVTANWADEWLRPYAAPLYIVLGLVFVASVGMSVWQVRSSRRTVAASIQQQARDEGAIERSPNRIDGATGGTICQTVSDKGRIQGSGNTIG